MVIRIIYYVTDFVTLMCIMYAIQMVLKFAYSDMGQWQTLAWMVVIYVFGLRVHRWSNPHNGSTTIIKKSQPINTDDDLMVGL